MGVRLIFTIFLLFYFMTSSLLEAQEEEITLDTVIRWAGNIGEELWKIGNEVTKLNDINMRYSEMKASVEKTDGDEILKIIATRMNKLVKEKVDAVLRIKNATMEAEKSFTQLSAPKDDVTYYSSKFSEVIVPDIYNKSSEEIEDKPEGLNFSTMILSPNPHFNGVLVNTNYSSVHVPTNIFDRWDNVIVPIEWSENLDETFRQNYEADPSLMWQYYASTSGFLRHYPAFHWTITPDRYDCRKRIWYIQAATCSKEVVILIDNSGTMYGMRNTIAQLTVDTLLKTFSNNDYISIFRLTDTNVTGLVKCFEDTLIQATPENIELFRNSLYRMCPEKKVDYKKGFKKAYTILHDFIKNKTEQVEKRNQAVFLLTDTLPPTEEFESIREMYHRIYNDTNIQVELFIHFIGKDIPDITEVQWEKCLRNGSLVHVRTLDEVPEDALKYLSIIARTQNESTENYPVSWTHTFFDIKKDRGKPIEENETKETIFDTAKPSSGEEFDHPEYGKSSELKMMTSVTTPVYSSNPKKNSQYKKEEMIGVAAIDVPISDFSRLTMAHKIGVNGYAFVVTNNGYILFHPYLKTVVDNSFRENFNSVDLTEVEFFDDNEIQPRKPDNHIFELRKKMVNQEMGIMQDMAIKFHYDEQKRVGTETRDYFFAPLKCSPFSLGLALPRGYGNYWVKTTDEISNAKSSNDGYEQYFEGNWTIHPKWSYCDFRNNTKYDYPDRKKKLMFFFDMIFNTTEFVWAEEHEVNLSSAENFTDTFGKSCFEHTKTEKPAQNYFCDKELIELLFFDAKLTSPEFKRKDNITYMREKKVRLKFVATQGGLTRWHNFFDENPGDENFGEEHGSALDEVWYKSAVLLHEPDSENFVLSVPRIRNYGRNFPERFISASHAIFYKEGGNEAPGVVVGFELAYDTLKRIAEKELSSVCHIDSTWDCYIIDANAFIIYSRYEQEIGKFYGTINGGGALMVDLVKNNLYRNISIFDYQALKDEEKKDPFTTAASTALFNPINHVIWMLNWAVSRIVWLLIESSLWQYVSAGTSCSSVVFLKNTTTCTTCKLENKTCPACCKAPRRYEDICQTREVPPHMEILGSENERPKKRPVDKKSFLYLSTSLSINGYSSANTGVSDDCSRPYFVKRINYTNLNLLLVRKNHSACFISVDVQPIEIHYSQGEDGDIPACNKKMINSYPRKKLQGCSDKVSLTKTIEKCGTASHIELPTFIILCSSMLSFLLSHFIT